MELQGAYNPRRASRSQRGSWQRKNTLSSCLKRTFKIRNTSLQMFKTKLKSKYIFVFQYKSGTGNTLGHLVQKFSFSFAHHLFPAPPPQLLILPHLVLKFHHAIISDNIFIPHMYIYICQNICSAILFRKRIINICMYVTHIVLKMCSYHSATCLLTFANTTG